MVMTQFKTTSKEYPLSIVILPSVEVTVKVWVLPLRVKSLVDIVTSRPETEIQA